MNLFNYYCLNIKIHKDKYKEDMKEGRGAYNRGGGGGGRIRDVGRKDEGVPKAKVWKACAVREGHEV
jgi:hypothetical protein